MTPALISGDSRRANAAVFTLCWKSFNLNLKGAAVVTAALFRRQGQKSLFVGAAGRPSVSIALAD